MNVGLHRMSVLIPLLFAVVMEVVSSDERSGIPSELLYVDYLVLMSSTMEQPGKRVVDGGIAFLTRNQR